MFTGFWCSPPCLGKGKTTGNQLIESRKRKNVWDQDIKKAAGGTNAGKTCDTGCAKKCAVSSPTNVGSANVSSNHLGGGGGGNGGDENEHPTNPDGDPDSDPDSGSDDTKKAEVCVLKIFSTLLLQLFWHVYLLLVQPSSINVILMSMFKV